MGSLELSCVFCQLFHALPRVGGKYIFYPHPKSKERAWGTCHILPFLLSCGNDNFFFPRILSADTLAKDKERMEKYQGAGPGQPPGEGRLVNRPAPGAIPFGMWPGAEQTDVRGRGERRQID